MKHECYKQICESFAVRAMENAFANRKGHGNSDEITRRVLSREELRSIIEAACRVTADEVVHYERAAPDMVRFADQVHRIVRKG